MCVQCVQYGKEKVPIFQPRKCTCVLTSTSIVIQCIYTLTECTCISTNVHTYYYVHVQHVRTCTQCVRTMVIYYVHVHIHPRHSNSRLAQSLMALRASLKLSWLGTSPRMASVTRQPFKLLTDFWSRFLSREASSRFRLSATLGWDSRENSRSI